MLFLIWLTLEAMAELVKIFHSYFEIIKVQKEWKIASEIFWRFKELDWIMHMN